MQQERAFKGDRLPGTLVNIPTRTQEQEELHPWLLTKKGKKGQIQYVTGELKKNMGFLSAN